MDRAAFCYRFGSAEFDESRFELRIAGLPVELERRAMEVLGYLLRHAGEVVTKEELLREVWAGRITVDKVLPNAINKLRRALGEANASLVTTLARVGYRLDGVVTRTAVGRQAADDMLLRAGDAVPGRPSFVLRQALGRAGSGDVWLAVHPKTQEARVFKFALDGDRLRALKREVTLLRVLQEGMADRSHLVELLDWNFETAPYFIECRYAGPSLAAWAGEHLGRLDPAARVDLFLQVADTVAEAHAVGVLHKDLKPDNVLVSGDAAQPLARLTDFGSGHLLEPDRLARFGITRMGLTLDERELDATSGTPLYVAPELYEGQAPTVRSDVYALGVLLYQLLSGRLGQPMAPGWEADIADELLREDLRLATDGNPARRLASAAELATRLRQLGPRRSAIALQREAQAAARRDHEALARAQARRPAWAALVAMLVLGIVVVLWQHRQAVSARDQAQLERDRAAALADFLNDDLIGRANPLVSAKGPDATLREVLLSARDRVGERFRAQPELAAAVQASLAMQFDAVDLFEDARAQAQAAIDQLERQGGGSSAAGLQARAVLVRALSRLSRADEARQQMEMLERLAADVSGSMARHQVAVARSAWLTGRGDFAGAAAALQQAIASVDVPGADQAGRRDMLRLELVSTLGLAAEREQAREQGERLIAEFRRRPGDQALPVALAQLALVRATGEDHAAAEALLLQAQPVIVARLGEDHSRHLRLLGELQGVAFRRGDWPRAIGYARALHERVRAKYGDEHVTTAVTLLNWARTLGEAGRATEGLDQVQTAHDTMVRQLGPAAPQVQDAAFVLAWFELEARHTARAQRVIEGLDPTVLEAFRATGIWRAGIDALRGIALAQRGDTAGARPLLASALATLKGEEDLAQPSRVYLLAQQAQARLR